jgi:hypothetical protein
MKMQSDDGKSFLKPKPTDMKTLALLLALIPELIYSQQASDSLPFNQDLITFVNMSLMSKVGDGTCSDLMLEAIGILDSVNAGLNPLLPANQIDSADFQAGDIVFYDHMIGEQGDTLLGHVAIVYWRGKHTYLIANQNTFDTLEQSFVVISHALLPEHEGICTVKSKFYRPYSSYFYVNR